jgi:hypothetical protein
MSAITQDRWVAKLVGLPLLLIAAACSDSTSPSVDRFKGSGINLLAEGVSGPGFGVYVCKVATVPGTYYFDVTAANTEGTLTNALAGTTTVAIDVLTANADPTTYCKQVWATGVDPAGPTTDVTITEQVPSGMEVDSILVVASPPGSREVHYGTTSETVSASYSQSFQVKFFDSEVPAQVCTDQTAINAGGPLPCVYGKTFSIGLSSMEGHLKIMSDTWFNGGYSFKFKNNTHAATQFTVMSRVEVPVTCPYGGGAGGTIVISLGTRTYNVPAGNTNWLPTGDANSILSWMGAVRTPDLCGGLPMDNARGALFTATVLQSPASGSLVDFRFKYRNPAAKGKVDTNCTDPTEPKRNDAATCGASWSETVLYP